MPNINLTGVEATANKSSDVNTDQASTTKYPNVKAVFDWAVGKFAALTGATFTGAISATNLSGTNTGDQNLSQYVDTPNMNTNYIPKATGATTIANSGITNASNLTNFLNPTPIDYQLLDLLSTNANSRIGTVSANPFIVFDVLSSRYVFSIESTGNTILNETAGTTYAKGGINMFNETASTMAEIDASKNIKSISVANTRTRLGITSGTIIVTSGTSFTTPSTITTSTTFFIEGIGAGGGGAATTTTNSTPGGGGGGYFFVKLTGLTASTTYTCAIGAGGAGGAAGGANNGSNGTATTLTIGATTYTANGGSGSVSAVSTSGGVGGTATNGDINISGQSGGDSGAANAAVILGEGGDSAKGWGNGGKETRATQTGNAGVGYGAGGAGGKTAGGGAGSDGIIYCEYIN